MEAGALVTSHGAIQALEEHDIYPEYIAGTSMGAIIGALSTRFKPPGNSGDCTGKENVQNYHLIT